LEVKNHYPSLETAKFITVKTGDVLELEGVTLAFLEAPLLYWPDSMFTLLIEEGVLFSKRCFRTAYMLPTKI